MAEIRYTAVHHRFGSRVVLDGIDLTISERRVGIVGANGSGKSTMARMINGLVSPTSGTVTVDGQDTTSKGRDVRRRVAVRPVARFPGEIRARARVDVRRDVECLLCGLC